MRNHIKINAYKYKYTKSIFKSSVCVCGYMSVDTSFANPQCTVIEFVYEILSCKAYKTHLVYPGYEIIYVFMKIHPLLSW